MANLNTYRLDLEFQVIGEWFMTNQTLDESIKGTLHYTEEDIILELYDTFGSIFDEKYNKLDFISGFSTDGKTIILRDLSISGGKENFPGFPTVNYYVQDFFILQENYNDASELYRLLNHITSNGFSNLSIKNVSFAFDYMNEWWNQSSIQFMKDFEKNIITMEADLGSYEVEEYEIPNKKIILKENVTVNFKLDGHIINEEHSLIIMPSYENQYIDFSSGIEYSKNIKNLIEFFINYPLKFTYIEFQYGDTNSSSGGEEEIAKKVGRYFFRGVGKRLSKNPKMNIKYMDIRSEFETILKNWFANMDKLEFIINSFIGDISLPIYINTQLLNSIRNLEIYHRNFIDKTHSREDSKILKNEKQILIDYIENNLSPQHQKRFIRNIKYNPEMTLSKRLVELFKKLPHEISEKIIKQSDKSLSKSIKSFAYKLTQIRNYYTHGDDKEKYKEIIEITENALTMYEYNRKLQTILKYFIYKELGISDKLILEILY